MQALIGDLAQPLPHLPIHIMQIGKLAQRPEVLTEVSDGAFDLTFFPAAGRIARMREKTMITGEAEESREKTNEAAIVFGDGGGQIIVSDFACHAAQHIECVNVTAGERSKALAVSELDI